MPPPQRPHFHTLVLSLLSTSVPLARAQWTPQNYAQEPLVASKGPLVDWNSLKSAVGGRLFAGVPFAHPCYTEGFNSKACLAVRESYLDEVTRANSPGAYIQTQWETCQIQDEDQCLLDFINPNDPNPTSSPRSCGWGSVPEHFIDVQTPEDVIAAFKFVNETKIPLVIKNTGHDYKGRSSAPGSLALWTHNLKNISYDPSFVPEGCPASAAKSGVTVGAGVQWGEAYAFAEANNITVVGGSDRSVGVTGGWLQGGGHGALSNTMGLGVDRVLEYKLVTPDGQYRVANECQNEDLFYALRGGGGGTYGVVLSSTILASPQVSLRALILSVPPSSSRTKELWTILTDNGLRWAQEGWGGFSTSGVVILINPTKEMGMEEARTSVEPFLEFAKRLKEEEGVEGVSCVFTEFESWGGFFQAFTKDHVAVVGSSLALASRLIPKNNLQTPEDRSALVSGFIAANNETPGMIILITAPSSFPYTPGKTSVNEAWRNSVYHVTVVDTWNWNATREEKRQGYEKVGRSIGNLRKLTPDAAYVNEADVYEPNHEVAFWGTHYEELLRLKNKFDPDHLLDCWQCVGWNSKSSRYSCYLNPLPESLNV